jgi:Dyp-type peroxidase family
MQTPQLDDIQGVLINGYSKLPYCNYHLIQISNPAKFAKWLKNQTFQNSVHRPTSYCQNIAFSAKGLQTMGIDTQEQNGFSIDFLEGMNTPHKNRTLGDMGPNLPINWEWGNNEIIVHVLLMEFCISAAEASQKKENLETEQSFYGINIIQTIESCKLKDDKEHFGFKDGLSNPGIKGIKEFNQPPQNILNPGEFILGYNNSYNILPLSPKIKGFDFGTNGSYLVARQLEQNVKQFWDTMMKFENNEEDKAIRLASKMVGRWPNGNSLIDADSPDQHVLDDKEINHFNYYKEDKYGYKCPIGSHIRRTNPRDALDDQPEESLDMSNKHRILRRGRPYGNPIVENMETNEIIQATDDNNLRGLFFICFNSDISRQFEFVQHTWANNGKFDGLYNDVDTIVGVHGSVTSNTVYNTQFEVQACPIRKRYENIPTFVTIKGGEYFFLPGIKAINYLTELN